MDIAVIIKPGLTLITKQKCWEIGILYTIVTVIVLLLYLHYGKAPKMINTPIWAFHGKKDINVPVSGSREMIGAIRLAGGNPLYTEYPDADHNIWKKVINTPGLVDWLFSKQKNNPYK